MFFGASHMVFGGEDLDEVDTGFVLPGSDVGRGVRIEILDTGLVDHEVFPRAPQVVIPTPPDDAVGHGTFITGVILRYAPAATIRSTKVLGQFNHVDDARLALRLLDIAESDEDIDILNLSMASPTYLNAGAFVVELALKRVKDRHPNIAIVAAAGNWHDDRPNYPAALKGIIAVAACKENGDLKDYSSFGWWVDARARGRCVSTYRHTQGPTSGWAEWGGTSFAAPVVVGAIAARQSQTGQTASAAAQHVFADRLSTAVAGKGVFIDPDDRSMPPPP